MNPYRAHGCRWIIAFWLCFALAQAQAAQPLLWLVEHQGNTSYLFGTIHTGHPELNQLPVQVEQGFNQADRFYAELEMTPRTLTQTALLMSLPPGQTLSALLNTSLKQRLEKLFQQRAPGLTLAQFERLKPWALAMTLTLLEDQLRYGQMPAMDMQLYQRAISANKAVSGLESPEQQVGVFDEMTAEQQLQFLEATVTAMEQEQASQKTMMDESYEAYRQGDPDSLVAMFDQQLDIEPPLRKQLKLRLIDQRNHWMASKIIEQLNRYPGQTLFIAVGAAHFDSRSGIQQLLKQQGYRVRRAAER